MNISELLHQFTASSFHIDVPTAFVDEFFKDRRLIAGTTKDYLERKKKLLDGIAHAVRMGGTEIWGQSTIEENYALGSLIRQMKPAVALEIGLFRGQTALTINRALNAYGNGTYLGIDIDQDTIEIVTQVLQSTSLGHGQN